MRRQKRTIIASQRRQAEAVLFCLLGHTVAGEAQSVLTPLPSYSVTPPAVQAEETGRTGLVQDWITGATILSPADFLVWGPVVLHPHVDYSVTYNDGIQSAPGQPNKSVVQQLSPGVLFVIGSHWTLDYDPTLTYYSSKALHDSVSQAATLTWGTSYEDWDLGLSQNYNSSSDPLIQTGTQTSTETYATSLTAAYRFNGEISANGSATQTITSAAQLSSSKSWNTLEFLNYEFLPRMTAGIGGGFGYDTVTSGSDMSHETLQVQYQWQVFRKLNFSAHGGVEDRQFLHSGLPNLISPTYGATIGYSPFTDTSFTLNLDRGISPSITSGSQASESTTLGVTLTQQLLKRLQLTLGATYSQVNYLASVATATENRTDTSYSFNSRLGLTVLKRVTLSATYSYNENSSTVGGFTFSSNQAGLEVGYRY